VIGTAAQGAPTAAVAPSRNPLGLAALVVLLVLGIAYIAYGTQDNRALGLTAVLAEYMVWVGLLAVAMLRSPGAVLRVSDPYLMLLGMGFNFLVNPGIMWLHGADLEHQWFELGRIRMDIFVQLQGLHVMFMVALSLLYFAIAPRHRFVPLTQDPNARLPDGRPWIALGLLPFLLGVAQRIISTGSFSATQNYGDIWTNDYAALTAVQAEGGSALVAAQFLGKVWFLPWLAVGIGEGLLLAKLLRDRRRLPLVFFALQAPVLLMLNSGGRSVIAAPFLIAIVVADVLAGPLRWRWVLSIGAVALLGLNFFGVYRAYRERDFGEAFALANEGFGTVSRSESLSAEGPIMLLKEHFAVAWTDANNYSRGVSYFSESILSLLPQQLVPEKLRYMNTATFLSREFLGRAAEAGAGIAGAIIADGYMIGRELGVIVLGAVLGAIAGAITRALSLGSARSDGRPMLWQVVLLASWSMQGIPFFRNDLAVIVSQLGSVLFIPVVLFALWVSLAPTSPWSRRVSSAG
jgi:hypothetical protein